jgi:tellurite resistance protein TerC
MFWLYLGFLGIIFALLALDLGVFNRTPHTVKVREALGWTAVWVSIGVAFSGLIYLGYEHQWLGLGTTADAMSTAKVGADGVAVYNDGESALIKYLTGFVVEKSLAVDNIFVIATIFGFLSVPPIYQHRVLFWGILGALVMRGAMIAVGAALMVKFSWIIYVFGGFLLLTGIKMLLLADAESDLSSNRVVRLFRRFIPITERYHGAHFLVRAGSAAGEEPATPGAPVERDGVLAHAKKGALLATPLLLALVLVELTDVIFAVDSIPAIFAITTDPFLVFTSNVFAILGLRSLYFALAGMIDRFHYLKIALSFVLIVVGTKMLAHSWLRQWLGENFNFVMLGVIFGIVAAGVIVSLARPPHTPAHSATH